MKESRQLSCSDSIQAMNESITERKVEHVLPVCTSLDYRCTLQPVACRKPQAVNLSFVITRIRWSWGLLSYGHIPNLSKVLSILYNMKKTSYCGFCIKVIERPGNAFDLVLG